MIAVDITAGGLLGGPGRVSGDRFGARSAGEVGERWRSEWHGAKPTGARSERAANPVHASRGTLGPTLLAFVAHRVAECPDRVGRGEGEPVAMDEGVQLPQLQLAVAAEDGETHRAEAAAPEPSGLVDRRGERCFVERRWSPAALPREGWVEAVTDVVEGADVIVALATEVVKPGVDVPERGHPLIGLDLQREPGGPIETAGHADDDVALTEVTEIVVPGGEHVSLWSVNERSDAMSQAVEATPSSPPPVTLAGPYGSNRRRIDP